MDDIFNKENAVKSNAQELPQIQWRLSLDRYLFGDGYLEADHYEMMSSEQKNVIQEIKKAKKRSTYVNSKGNLHHSLE